MASRVLLETVKVLSALFSLALAALLAIWFGAELGQEVNAGVPGEQMRHHAAVAALLLIPSVMLVIAHRRPSLFTEQPVWWSSPVLAAASFSWVYVAQSMAGRLGV